MNRQAPSMHTWIAAIVASVAIYSVAVGAEPAGRERIRFDDGWRFHLGDFNGANRATASNFQWKWKGDDRGDAAAAEMAAPGLDVSDWQTLTSSHENVFVKTTKVWFRTKLEARPDKRPVVYFGGFNDYGTVYFNGKKVHRSEAWRESFDVDLTDLWQKDGPNVLAVMVENVDCQAGALGIVEWKPEISEAATAADYDDNAWQKVHLPHDYVVEGTFDAKHDRSHGYLPVDVGWYRKTFTLPAADKGRRLWIDFDGVYRDSTVWLNGKRLGGHKSGYTPSRYDISKEANFGGKNVLTVRVDPRTWEGWWYDGGGIYRHVWLTKADPVHVAPNGVYVTSTVRNDGTAEVTVHMTIVNDSDAAARLGVGFSILDADGIYIGCGYMPNKQIAAGGKIEVSASVVIDQPDLWSIESPYLYRLMTNVRVGSDIVDRTETPFGIRTIKFDADKGFFLNGKSVKIKGTCNHLDHAGLGTALPDSVYEWRIKRLKEMGSNAYRCSHNPPPPELLDACDRLGMLVMDENRKLGDTPAILSQVETMVKRDRNHPSVIIWSLCNEEGEQGTEKARKEGEAMKAVIKRLDPTRPVSGAMNGEFGKGLSNVFELQGFNYFIKDYDEFHKKFPKQPCFGSETASAVGTRGRYTADKALGHLSAYDIHAPHWGASAENAWKAIAERPWMAGSFVWTGFDYRGEPTPYDWPCISSHFGIMDTCGFPKDTYYYYQSWWSDKPVLHLLPHWNWAGKEGQPIDVWCYSNCDKVELSLNGKSLGTKEMPRNGHLEWKVPYAPGKLEAKGFKNGEQAATETVETTGAPATLRLTPDRTVCLADGEDVILVAVDVLDDQGRVVPTADNEIQFKVTGKGRVAGVGNGDPSSHERDKASKRHAFYGHCMVAIGASDEPGEIELTATSPGLSPEKIVVQSSASESR